MDMQLKVPDQVEFMAVIGTKYSELTRPKLSSFNINMRELGFKGMETLAKLILHPELIIHEKLPFGFVSRGTTK